MATSVSEMARIWDKTLKKISEKLNEKKTFDAFFADSYIYEINGNRVTVIAKDLVAKTVLSGQYYKLISSILNDVTEDEYELEFLMQDEVKAQKAPKISTIESVNEERGKYFGGEAVDPNLTFDNFVVGDFNKEAHKAAYFVATNKNTLFNPLFIYSHSGLGKTHLLHAIGNEIKNRTNPNARILYITANDFVDEYVKFIRAEKGTPRAFFSDVDVLLFDDVQFMADKVRTQEMFFYIYQDLINKGKKIIITSDRQPSELKGLEDRLVTRFSQGLTVKIEELDKISCEEILKSKIVLNGLDLNKIDPTVITFFASTFSNNIRELEGALNRLIFYSFNLNKSDIITMDIAADAIGSLKGSNSVASQLSAQRIINTVSDYYNISSTQLAGKSRTGQIALARHIAMWLIRKYFQSLSLEKIGDLFGGRDHTTVASGISKVDKELKTDEQLKKAISELEKLID